MTADTQSGIQDLRRQYPEWKPWLGVVEAVLAEATDRRWESCVPTRTVAQSQRTPLLSGLTFELQMGHVQRWTQRLIQTACQSGAPKMSNLGPARHARFDIAGFFEAALCHDVERLSRTAEELGLDGEALQSVAALVAVPFLQACSHRWATDISESWVEGYCPVCAAWPAFAEVRGIERSRYFRCGRCGSAWEVHCLFCPYCGMTDHRELESLIPEQSATRSVEACKRCLGYVKSFITLQGSPPAKVLLDDLASVELDIAALEQNYRRPEGLGYSLKVSLVATDVTLKEKFLFWR